jgi:hypothetical protein
VTLFEFFFAPDTLGLLMPYASSKLYQEMIVLKNDNNHIVNKKFYKLNKFGKMILELNSAQDFSEP